MDKHATRIALWGLLLLMASPSSAAQAADRASCIAHIHSEFSEAQRRLQRDLQDLVAAEQAQLSQVAALNADFQLKLIQQREQRFRFLARRHPERIDAVQGIMGLINLTRSFSKKDQDALLDQDAGYWVLQKSIDEAQIRTTTHRDWPALQNFFRTSMPSNPAFLQSQKRLEAAVGKADEGIARCAH